MKYDRDAQAKLSSQKPTVSKAEKGNPTGELEFEMIDDVEAGKICGGMRRRKITRRYSAPSS